MHIEQCNVVVIIEYEIKSMKTLEDTISYHSILYNTHFNIGGAVPWNSVSIEEWS